MLFGMAVGWCASPPKVESKKNRRAPMGDRATDLLKASSNCKTRSRSASRGQSVPSRALAGGPIPRVGWASNKSSGLDDISICVPMRLLASHQRHMRQGAGRGRGGRSPASPRHTGPCSGVWLGVIAACNWPARLCLSIFGLMASSWSLRARYTYLVLFPLSAENARPCVLSYASVPFPVSRRDSDA